MKTNCQIFCLLIKKTTFVEKYFSNILTFRQELRLEPRGKPLKNEDTLDSLGIKTGALLYFKVHRQFCFILQFQGTSNIFQTFNLVATDGSIQDRGLQIGWTTVFLAEYAGPLLVNIFSEHFLNSEYFSLAYSQV